MQTEPVETTASHQGTEPTPTPRRIDRTKFALTSSHKQQIARLHTKLPPSKVQVLKPFPVQPVTSEVLQNSPTSSVSPKKSSRQKLDSVLRELESFGQLGEETPNPVPGGKNSAVKLLIEVKKNKRLGGLSSKMQASMAGPNTTFLQPPPEPQSPQTNQHKATMIRSNTVQNARLSALDLNTTLVGEYAGGARSMAHFPGGIFRLFND